MKVQAGDKAPEFELNDQDGKPWRLEDRRGKPVVLYFYPMDDTKGCTAQACDVRDHWSEFGELDVEVAGISPDDVDSHRSFVSKYELPHTLLADPEREVIDAYGTWGPVEFKGKTYEAVIRSSVVIGPDGTVVDVFDTIRPEEQSAKALESVRRLQAGSA